MKLRCFLLVVFAALAFGAKAQTLTANEIPDGINPEDYGFPRMEEYEQQMPKDADLCSLSFENATGYYVDVWIDKSYKGRITPWKRMALKIISKDSEVYFRTSGGTFQWYSKADCDSAFVLEVEEDED
ncbi:MAG: hypothetical protein J5542_11190 [Bacteroidales bacterium]|nr:hypothetical protein [Bacteroidales bacterium]MBQ2542158.1 hypothetical protein [Bacteroidales bacterium]